MESKQMFTKCAIYLQDKSVYMAARLSMVILLDRFMQLIAEKFHENKSHSTVWKTD